MNQQTEKTIIHNNGKSRVFFPVLEQEERERRQQEIRKAVEMLLR